MSGRGWPAWHAQHGRKRVYATRRQARWAALRRRARSLFTDRWLNAYSCQWTGNWKDGPQAGPLHWHTGHRRKNRTWLRAHVLWPYYRARRRWRARRNVTT